MDPLSLIQTIMTLGMAIPGFTMHDRGLEQVLNLLNKYSSPQAVLNDANSYYKSYLTSPAYSAARAGINTSANRAAESVASSNAMRGLTGTGIGAITQALGSNTAGFQLGNLQSQAWNNSLQQAMELAKSRFSGAGYLQTPRNIGQNTWAGLVDWFGKLDLHKLFPGQPTRIPSGGGGGTGNVVGSLTDPFGQLYGH